MVHAYTGQAYMKMVTSKIRYLICVKIAWGSSVNNKRLKKKKKNLEYSQKKAYPGDAVMQQNSWLKKMNKTLLIQAANKWCDPFHQVQQNVDFYHQLRLRYLQKGSQCCEQNRKCNTCSHLSRTIVLCG